MTIMEMLVRMRIRMTIMVTKGKEGKEDEDNYRNEDDYDDEGDENGVDGDYQL